MDTVIYIFIALLLLFFGAGTVLCIISIISAKRYILTKNRTITKKPNVLSLITQGLSNYHAGLKNGWLNYDKYIY
jgi:hypothetical protein